MAIGKTSSSITVTELFNKYSETQILKAAFPEITQIPCRICSPFRIDKHPSFSIYLTNDHHIRFKDFGDPDSHGSLLDLLCKKWQCSFSQVFGLIVKMMQQDNCSELTVKPKKIRLLTRREITELTEIQVAVHPWNSDDIAYWQSYGITKKWLQYAEVYPISHKIVTKKKTNPDNHHSPIIRRYIFPADKYAYCYVERKGGNLSLKIYQPFNTQGYKWCSRMDSSVISLWTKVPQQGDRIVICSSLKDALCLSCQLHIPAIALQGEGYTMSQKAANELKRRFDKVFICYDTDNPGIKDAEKLSLLTGFPFIVPDLGNCKDISDYYKSLKNKEDFQQLEKYFH